MNTPLHHRASIVAELVERLGSAENEDDQNTLAEALAHAGDDLEAACLAVLRECRTRKAMAKAIKDTIIADAKARAERMEQWSEKGRSLVAQALSEAGLPKLTAPDMTVSFRMGGAPLIIDREPTLEDAAKCLATEHVSYKWDKDVLWSRLKAGDDTITFARLGNPAPVLTVRTK